MSCNLSFIFDCPIICEGPGGSMSQVVGLPNNSFKPITNTAWVRPRICKLQKRVHSTRSASDKAYELLAHGRWFPPGTLAFSTNKIGRHDIDEISLKVALNTIIQPTNQYIYTIYVYGQKLYFLYELQKQVEQPLVNLSILCCLECKYAFGFFLVFLCFILLSSIFSISINAYSTTYRL